MKFRSDYVTNSSSSSFVIAKKYLDEDQLDAIRENGLLGERLGIPHALGFAWEIRENSKYIEGSTIIDNYSIWELFEIIGINDAHVHWNEYLPDEDDDFYDDCNSDEQHDWRGMLKEIMGAAIDLSGGSYED